MLKNFVFCMAVASTIVIGAGAQAADPQRIADVARRGPDVMPFDLQATTHVFTKTDTGGVQRVVAKDAADTRQVELVRAHMRDIQAQFMKGDFSGPSHIHGQDMPGLAQLQAARAGQLAMAYADVPGGAQLTYSAKAPELVMALHAWFDAQVSDHGPDAMAGHHHDMHKPQ